MHSSEGGVAASLTGRRAERRTLDQLVAAIRNGESRSLVVYGDAGVGKTALLEYLAGQATGCQIARAAGVQSEMELAFAGLHQLCAPLLDHLDGLPVPQRDALRSAFGMSAGPAPDQFLIGLAVLSLLSDAAERRPLLCVIDDEQWVDSSSANVLAFVARRLGAESVGMAFGVRVPGKELTALAELHVTGLPVADARELLDSALVGPMDSRVRDQIVAESLGNPLALLEISRGLTAAELAGGFALPGAASVSGDVETSFRRRITALPPETQRLLLLAAADPTGDSALVWRAAEQLGIEAAAAGPAVESGLAEIASRVRFRHPLVRSVIYSSALSAQRQAVHGALAQATDRALDPDRRIWHLAEAASGPDENIAAELVLSAEHAQARGGLAAAAAFLERATLLTLDEDRKVERALAAAGTKLQAGAFEAATNLLAATETGPLSELQQARVDLVRAQLAFATSRGGEAPLLLLRAARRFHPIEPSLARETYLDAISAAAFAGRLATPGGHVLEAARSAATAPRPAHPPRAPDLLLDGLAANFSYGYPAGAADLRAALAAFGSGMSLDEELRWMWLINLAALHLWDDEDWDALSARYLQLARKAGAVNELPLALSTRALMLSFVGDLTTVSALVDEQHTVTEATGIGLAPYAGMRLAAMRGQRAQTLALVEQTAAEAPQRGEGISVAVAEWTRAVLYNGLGNYSEAMAAAKQALYHQEYPDIRYPGVANWAAAEFIEAAVYSGMVEAAAEATRWITEMTGASGTAWALGVEARSRALLAEGEDAERHYKEAIAHLGPSRVRTELARTYLLYGEWLRRERRRSDAREYLGTARQMLDEMGMAAFADRAQRELLAIGGAARKRTLTAGTADLTTHERQVARLARDGLSNPEIGARLFISPKTVQYHLSKVFVKLEITSRSQLVGVLV
ncbi:helix-turn-helix transcriptional regulator [Mycolicibacterium stellerae]|uniref:helix-turn-helix transcriptional regulator n=1 Tax=Mycolicibacterium stellerae TaxID=2358193 RepID=UPI000F0AF829|nr:LuxR family transcriptional regulator [Mycolicibacterium stellerae]